MSLYTHFDHHSLPIGPDGTPWDYLEALRAEALETETPIGWSTARDDGEFDGFWVCTGYQEGRDIFYDTDTFSNRDVIWPAYAVPGARPIMLAGHDDPLHKKYRKLVQSSFSPAAAVALTDYFKKDVNVLMDGFIDEGEVDIVKGFTARVPGRFTALILGMNAEDGERIAAWAEAMVSSVSGDPEEAAPDLEDMGNRFHQLLDARRKNPGDDIFSRIVHLDLDGRPLTVEEIQDFFTVILLGGLDNSEMLFSTMMWRLAWDKDLRRRLVHNPQLHETVLDEILRL